LTNSRQRNTSEDSIAAIRTITTSRNNGYTTAADDYRTLLLHLFGCNSDGTPMGIRKVVLMMKPAMCLYHGEKVVEWLEEKKARMKVVYLPPSA